MQLESYRTIFSAVCLIGILLFASPTIALLIKPPISEPFTQLYILGPNQKMEDLPYKIQAGVQYTVYLGLSNHMGSSNYYTCNVKLRNETEAFPNTTLGAPSSLPTLYEYKQLILDEQSWEAPLTFKINNITILEGKLLLSSITINGVQYTVNKEAQYDLNKDGFFYSLFVELWIFNPHSGVTEFNNRYVSFTLKPSYSQ